MLPCVLVFRPLLHCSGKSSRVPQLLQAELNGPIICTQPRRLAVVAIAKHVAELTGSELGRDVGFRIGQKSVASTKTKLLFTTAGLLLEELRANVCGSRDTPSELLCTSKAAQQLEAHDQHQSAEHSVDCTWQHLWCSKQGAAGQSGA